MKGSLEHWVHSWMQDFLVTTISALDADSGIAGVVLLGTEAETIGMPESEADDEDAGLAKLLTPGRMPASASTARFNTTDAALGASPSLNADPARSGGGPSTSESQQEAHQLPPELAEEPPGPVDPAIQVLLQTLFFTVR